MQDFLTLEMIKNYLTEASENMSARIQSNGTVPKHNSISPFSPLKAGLGQISTPQNNGWNEIGQTVETVDSGPIVGY